MSEAVESGEGILLRRYQLLLGVLGVTEDQLQKKKLVDVACGEGALIYGLLRHAVTTEAYGIDINTRDAENNPTIQGNVIEHDYLNPFPKSLSGADFVVSFASPTFNFLEVSSKENGEYQKEIQGEFTKMLDNMLGIASPGAEIIFGGVQLLEGHKPMSLNSWQFLNQLLGSRDAKFEFRYTGKRSIRRYPKHKKPQEGQYDTYALVIHKPKADNVRT